MLLFPYSQLREVVKPSFNSHLYKEETVFISSPAFFFGSAAVFGILLWALWVSIFNLISLTFPEAVVKKSIATKFTAWTLAFCIDMFLAMLLAIATN